MELKNITLELFREKIYPTLAYKSEQILIEIINEADFGTYAYHSVDKNLINQLVGAIGSVWTVGEMMDFIVEIAIEVLEAKGTQVRKTTEHKPASEYVEEIATKLFDALPKVAE